MDYLCMAIGTLGITLFGYIFIIDRQVKNMNKRLDARLESKEE